MILQGKPSSKQTLMKFPLNYAKTVKQLASKQFLHFHPNILYNVLNKVQVHKKSVSVTATTTLFFQPQHTICLL